MISDINLSLDGIIYYMVDNVNITSISEYLEGMSINIYDWTLVFAVAFLLLELLNDVVTKRFSQNRFVETLSSLGTQIPYYFSEFFVFSLAVFTYFTIYEYITWKIPSTIEMFLVVLILADLTYYVEHYLLHKIRVLWTVHSVHHSSHMMNTATAFRFSIFDPLASFIFHIPLLLMGFNPMFIFAAEILVLAYQFWLHNEMIGKLGPFEWLFNTPSHHRVHHATNRKYIDKNFGGILIIWDRIFGTFQKEEELPKYGIYPQIKTVNPIKVQFSEFAHLFRDLASSKSLSDVIGYLFKAPGWESSNKKK